MRETEMSLRQKYLNDQCHGFVFRSSLPGPARAFSGKGGLHAPTPAWKPARSGAGCGDDDRHPRMTPDVALMGQLAGLFAAAFGAATILPFQSEVVFVGLQLAGTASLSWLIVVASVGNTLGAVVNYVMGRGIERFRTRRWFPVNAAQLARA